MTDQPSTMVRWVPRLLAGVAGTHLLVGCTLLPASIRPNPFAGILSDGLVDAIRGDLGRETAFWFNAAGVGWLALAHLTHWTIRRTGRVPAPVGWWSIGIAAPSVVLMPVSGFWLLLGVGVFTLAAARQPAGPQPALPQPARQPAGPTAPAPAGAPRCP